MNNIKFTYSEHQKSNETTLEINFNDFVILDLKGFTYSDLIDLKALFQSEKSNFDIEYGYNRDEIQYDEISKNIGIMKFTNHDENTTLKIKIYREAIIRSLDETKIIF